MGVHSDAVDISFPWFRRVRYVVWGGQLALVLLARFIEVHLRLSWLFALVAVGFLSDAAAWWWQRTRVTENRVLSLMVLDAMLHTAVFALSGGPFNPFTTLYLVNIVLGTLVLSRGRQWAQFVISLIGFGSLFWVEKIAPAEWELPSHQELMRLHLTGMWLAFFIAAAFIVYFMQRVLSGMRARDAALAEARRVHAQNEKLAALTTLAAGAAHELATPLGTIAVASAEMARALSGSDSTSLRDDVALVQEQVNRCRTILQSMSARSGELAGESASTFSLDSWVRDAMSGLRDAQRVSFANEASATVSITGPRAALSQALRNVVKNALEASAPAGPVTLTLDHAAGAVTVAVRDSGEGMPAKVIDRLGEPFFTTKPVGSGLGLGVFLARTLAQQLGGTLEFESTVGKGTVARFHLPIETTPR